MIDPKQTNHHIYHVIDGDTFFSISDSTGIHCDVRVSSNVSTIHRRRAWSIQSRPPIQTLDNAESQLGQPLEYLHSHPAPTITCGGRWLHQPRGGYVGEVGEVGQQAKGSGKRSPSATQCRSVAGSCL